jgi:hypothetical protein
MTNVLTKQGDKAPNCQGLAWCSNKNIQSRAQSSHQPPFSGMTVLSHGNVIVFMIFQEFISLCSFKPCGEPFRWPRACWILIMKLT